MLSDEQRAEFDELGFVRVPGVFSDGDAAIMCAQLWEALARQHGVRRDAPETWTVEQPRHLAALRQAGAFDAIGGPALCAAIDDLLGVGCWQHPQDWGGPLVTFAVSSAEWNVPHANWHMDLPAAGSTNQLIGLRLLAFVVPVKPRGGGTVVIAGSHRLVAGLVARSSADKLWRSPVVRRTLAHSHPWFRDLMSKDDTGDRVHRFMHEGALIDGVAVRVVELTGAPGDVVLLHPWLFHASAPNCRRTPRMMVTGGVFQATPNVA